MLKSSFRILFGAIILFSVASCKKTKNEVVTSLHEDQNFIDVVKQTNSILSLIKEKIIVNPSLNIKIDTLTKISNVNNQFAIIKNSFGTDVISKMQDYSAIFSSKWTEIKKRHQNLTTDEIQKEVIEVYKVMYKEKLAPFTSTVNGDDNGIVTNSAVLGEGSPCGWRYYLCAASATAAAILCDAACTGATVGLGVVPCTAACLTIQASALVVCQDNYCPIL